MREEAYFFDIVSLLFYRKKYGDTVLGQKCLSAPFFEMEKCIFEPFHKYAKYAAFPLGNNNYHLLPDDLRNSLYSGAAHHG